MCASAGSSVGGRLHRTIAKWTHQINKQCVVTFQRTNRQCADVSSKSGKVIIKKKKVSYTMF